MTQVEFFPGTLRVTVISGQWQTAHPAIGWRIVPGTRCQHLHQPIGLYLKGCRHAGLMTQPARMHPLQTQHLAQTAQVASAQQTGVQGKVKASGKALPFLHQCR
ncbi:hypothetical protein D3C81_1730630 [compost metagenome]